jgi:hypothetical protein
MVTPADLNSPGVETNGVHLIYIKYQNFSRIHQKNCPKIITRVSVGNPPLGGIKASLMKVLTSHSLTFEV